MTTVRIRIEVDGRELDFPASVGQPEGDPSPLVAHLLRALAERVETAGIERLTAENARLVEHPATRYLPEGAPCGPMICEYPDPRNHRRGDRWTCQRCGTRYYLSRRIPLRWWRDWAAPYGEWRVARGQPWLVEWRWRCR